MSTTHRRAFLLGAGAAAAFGGPVFAADAYANSPFRKLTDAQWKERLKPFPFEILRHEATEPPGSSPLTEEKRKGSFACLGCGLPLFQSDWKYDSGTGWPSFYTAIKGALATKVDHKLGYARTEYHCARCLGHHGHIFDDGPPPTGKRYCSNGAVLNFTPA